MITAFDIYMIGTLNAVENSLGSLIGVFGFIAVIATGLSFLDKKPIPSFVKKIAMVIIIVVCVMPFIPSAKTYAAMLVLPKIANNESIGNITNNTLQLLESKTAEWLMDIQGKEDKGEAEQ